MCDIAHTVYHCRLIIGMHTKIILSDNSVEMDVIN